MLSGLTTLLQYFVTRKTALFVLVLGVIAVLSSLSLYALSYVKTLSRVYDVFYPPDPNAVATIVVSSDALSPFTSIVDARSIEEKLSSFNNIKVQSILVTVGLIDNRPVVVYATDYANSTCVYASKNLLEAGSFLIGDFIAVQSPFTGEILVLRICGEGDKPGISVSYENAVKLRGVKQGYYSFIVVYVYSEDMVDKVYSALVPQPRDDYTERLIRRAFLLLTRRGEDVEVANAETPTEIYLAKLGIHREYIVYLAYAVGVATLASLPLMSIGVVLHLENRLRTLISMGASRGIVLASLLVYFLIAVAVSVALSSLFFQLGLAPPLVFLDHEIPLTVGIREVITVAIVNYTLLTVGVFTGLRRLES
ncbi:MAG: hypothetical protein QW764_04380 [Desulfurococcaceae archaeon]